MTFSRVGEVLQPGEAQWAAATLRCTIKSMRRISWVIFLLLEACGASVRERNAPPDHSAGGGEQGSAGGTASQGAAPSLPDDLRCTCMAALAPKRDPNQACSNCITLHTFTPDAACFDESESCVGSRDAEGNPLTPGNAECNEIVACLGKGEFSPAAIDECALPFDKDEAHLLWGAALSCVCGLCTAECDFREDETCAPSVGPNEVGGFGGIDNSAGNGAGGAGGHGGAALTAGAGGISVASGGAAP